MLEPSRDEIVTAQRIAIGNTETPEDAEDPQGYCVLWGETCIALGVGIRTATHLRPPPTAGAVAARRQPAVG